MPLVPKPLYSSPSLGGNPIFDLGHLLPDLLIDTDTLLLLHVEEQGLVFHVCLLT